MSKNKYFILGILALLNSCTPLEHEKYDENTYPEIVKTFFNKYKESPETAISNVFTSSKWIEMEMSNSKKDSLVLQLKEVTDLLGKFEGYEVMKIVSAGDSYKVISTIAKYQRQPVRFNFLLYKPSEKWQIQNFTFDFNIEEELMNNTNLSFDF